MRAVTFRDVGDFQIEDVPKPSLQAASDVLLKVTLGAICGSDLHIYHGHTPINPGAVIGHEFTGVIEEVGPEVRRFRAGDRVVASFFTACGHCYLCRRGWFAQCVDKGTFGHGEYFGNLGGGQAEWVVVPLADHTLEVIPEGMSDEQAIFVGDILSTAYFGAERAEIRPGDTVAVIGAGPVGLLAVMAAQLFGPARVYAVDMIDARLELAQELGAIPVNAAEVHPVEFLEKATHGHGVDRSIECVGLISAVDTAFECVRGGGTISMVGVPSKTEWQFPIMQAWMKDLTFRAGWCNVQAYMRPLLDLVAAGRLQPERIISHRMRLEEAPEAYRMFDAREATKIVLTP
ncbi:MAG: zinc-binding dehydrogenase [Chloroflexi bacterium]|nr:MAG: zinc-binding dehydrogenase [Chloroflexota bacterium]